MKRPSLSTRYPNNVTTISSLWNRVRTPLQRGRLLLVRLDGYDGLSSVLRRSRVSAEGWSHVRHQLTPRDTGPVTVDRVIV